MLSWSDFETHYSLLAETKLLSWVGEVFTDNKASLGCGWS